MGGGGMLGHKLVQVLEENFEVWTTFRTNFEVYEKFGIFKKERTIENINVENFEAVESVLGRVEPQVVVNAVGIVKQLPSSKSVVNALTINSIFPNQLAEAAGRGGARLINISTDCVFSGKKGKYTEADAPDADDLYGKSKNLGEVTTEHCLTFRTSIIGRELNTAHSLVEWFLSNRGKKVKGFSKAIFSGFPTLVLSEIIADVIENHPRLNGLYHLSSAPINKFDLLELVNEAYQSDVEIERFEDFAIDRSLDSTKFREATGFRPAAWEEMVEKMAADDALYQNKR